MYRVQSLFEIQRHFSNMFDPKAEFKEIILEISQLVRKILWRLASKIILKVFKRLINFRVINIIQKDRNLTSFLTCSHKINIFLLT